MSTRLPAKRVYRKRKPYKKRAAAPMRRVRGRGNYTVNGPYDGPVSLRAGESLYRTPFADTGAHIGSMFGPRAGRIARGIGSAIGGIFGSGDYKMGQHNVKGNSLISNNTIPQFMQSNALIDGIHITHREYITDISCNGAEFTTQNFLLNPGLSSTFPWLSQVSPSFQQYRINGLLMCFKSTSADAISSGTNTALGSVVMSFNYNSAANPFVSKQQQLQSDWAVDCKPSESFCAPLECKRSVSSLTELYVRTGGLSATENQQFYDFANFQISTQGMQSGQTNVVGELWVTYDITLLKPIQSLQSIYDYSILFSLPNTSAFFGSPAVGQTLGAGNTLTMTITSNAFIFPSYITNGLFFVTYNCRGDEGTWSRPTIVASGCVISAFWLGNTQQYAPSTNIVTSSVDLTFSFQVLVTEANASITFGGGAIPTNAAGNLTIIQVNPNFIN